MYKYLATSILLLLAGSIFGQQRLNYSDELIKEMATEVFKDCPQYLTNEYIDLYKKRFAKVSIIKLERGAKKQDIFITKRLSAVGLKNKCNSNLKYDIGDSFDPDKFNVLKYFFPINEDVKAVYILVDNTHYVIRVER